MYCTHDIPFLAAVSDIHVGFIRTSQSIPSPTTRDNVCADGLPCHFINGLRTQTLVTCVPILPSLHNDEPAIEIHINRTRPLQINFLLTSMSLDLLFFGHYDANTERNGAIITTLGCDTLPVDRFEKFSNENKTTVCVTMSCRCQRIKLRQSRVLISLYSYFWLVPVVKNDGNHGVVVGWSNQANKIIVSQTNEVHYTKENDGSSSK